MFISVVKRIKGERDPWWEDVLRLLSGHGVRRMPPEQLALTQSLRALGKALEEAGVSSSHVPIHVVVSHAGTAADRAATVVAFANSTVSVGHSRNRVMPSVTEDI